MNSAESPRNETTKLRALATGLRLMTTAAPKISVISAKNQNRNGDIIDCGSRIAGCGNKDGRRVENQQLAILLISFRSISTRRRALLRRFRAASPCDAPFPRA